MRDFVGAAFGFPTALFSVLLIVVVLYWLIVLLGALDLNALDHAGHDVGGHDVGGHDGHDGHGGVLDLLGLGGVPVTVSASFLIAIAWFVSLSGTALFGGVLAAILVLLVALVAGWAVTRLLALGLSRFFVQGPSPKRADFLGRPCVIRTGSVTETFGQAEVTASDGSSAIVQVRQSGTDHSSLRSGVTAYIYGYDDDGEFFWVVESPDPTPAK
jgi:hypothetical protein